MKARPLKASGILFILSGLTWFLAAALSAHRRVLVGLGVMFLCVGIIFIARSKKSVIS